MEIIFGLLNPNRTYLNILSEQQASQLNYYNKVYKYDNDLVKKIETYNSGALYAIDYYLDLGENETDLLDQFYQSVDYVSFFDRKIPVGIFLMEKERVYDKNVSNLLLNNHRIRVYDNKDRIVCVSSTDKNNYPYPDSTIKYSYELITTIDTDGSSSSDQFYLEFTYYKGEISGIDINEGHLVEDDKHLIDDLDDINEVLDRFGGSLSDYQYYLSPHWMPS